MMMASNLDDGIECMLILIYDILRYEIVHPAMLYDI